ncbi:GNAT family N-acetyltransferase [Streptomyces sp. NPDC004111]|uniref:GNAT family N-acetyltransferase n=1 Tax=Streptomyces sp. NPDC004111 TaxID=3364690 RepID=UPI0036987609
MDHGTVRRAHADDAAEVLRLRQMMLESMGRGPTAADWQNASLPELRKRLADQDGDFAVFVAEHPSLAGRLGTMAAGTVDYRIGNPVSPLGNRGHVFGVVTAPDARRAGGARACTEALLDWFRERGVRQVDLGASAEAEPLYTSLGFTRRPDPAMRLDLF